MTGAEARDIVEASVRRELFGPSPDEPPRGKPLDCSNGSVHFESNESARGIWHDQDNGQEILTESEPLRRYGIGVLNNGAGATAAGSSSVVSDPDLSWVSGLPTDDQTIDDSPQVDFSSTSSPEADTDDFDLSDANSFKPSAMAITFKCRVRGSGSIQIVITGAYYDRIAVHVTGSKNPWTWWQRRPFDLSASVETEALVSGSSSLLEVPTVTDTKPRIRPGLRLYSRPVPDEDDPQVRLVTVAIINDAPGTGSAAALFQVGLQVSFSGEANIVPYSDHNLSAQADEETQSIALLYRNKRTFAIGHGCAASWTESANGETADVVGTEALPVYEVPSLTPDVYISDPSGQRVALNVSMRALADDSAEGREQVESVLALYEDWVSEREAEIAGLPIRFHAAARTHIRLCKAALTRMKSGWNLIHTDDVAARAFRLTNQAMFFQQIRSRLLFRSAERMKDGTITIAGGQPAPTPKPGTGNWRPFQIAFLLATLPELVNRTATNRDTVDLIFFPTGGGKTEAYLAASAISLLARRLHDPTDAGTDTIMRYTLRLLTAQQFLRAATLMCVLEDIRSGLGHELGDAPFGIGIWLGGSSTPNTWKQAVTELGSLRRYSGAQNKFLLLRCPWCGAQMGPLAKGRGGQDVIGYETVGKKVALRCHDNACRFGGRNRLPIHIVDEDIYDERPSLVIGTVDKFAMLPWRPKAGRIFGLSVNGAREVSPPGLIIQDELHLISGPLGSMVGLYEPIIEDLCTDHRTQPPVLPKIIASTATIRRFDDQVRALYGREHVALFPPHGLEEGSSFFAETATESDGSKSPGRRYLGVMSASLGSTQTVQVRVAAATLQAGVAIPEADRDGYWTNLNFFNSLRELGNTVSLMQSDIPDYLTGLRRREQLQDEPRWPRTPLELTSRRRSDEIPKAIEQLQISYGHPGCIDVCLASNIIEVGIDIDRLGLMTIVGQPKTTAQYIQVSGRVGRDTANRPGLVITIYGAAKPRDRSHYERFRTYHQSLYSQVEPTSVTPFATPVLNRALHAAAIARIRQMNPGLPAHPFPSEQFDEAIELLRNRVLLVDKGELGAFEKKRSALAKEWSNWDRTEWDANTGTGDPLQGLMRYAGSLPIADSKALIWDVPTSMRNVDAECQLKVTLAYNEQDASTSGAES